VTRLTACLSAVILAAVLALAACQQGEKTVLLRYKFAPGLQLVYNQDMKRNVLVARGDSIIEKSSTAFKVRVMQTIEEVRDENTALMREVDSWSYTVPSREDTLKRDSVSMERTMRILMQSDGNVLDVKFDDSDDLPSQNYIKHFMEQGMPVFPPGEVSPGFSWTQTAKVLLPNENMEASTTYEVVAFVREAGYDCALLNVDGNLVIPVEPNPKDSVQRFGVDRIRTTGKMYFAFREGMVVLQRERWIIQGDYTRVKKSDTATYDVRIEADVDYALESRKITP